MKRKEWQELLSETKALLKNSITTESSKEQIDQVAKIDSQIDGLNKAYEELDKEYESLKDSYLEQVKNTGFKSNEADNDISGETKSLDEIMSEELQKITQK